MLSTDVYNTLLERLLSGKLLPGASLNRRQIAEEFGVSVAPVLEAFMQLEHEGFLITVPRRGTTVRTLTKKDIKGNLILKEAIECAAAERYSGETVQLHYGPLEEMATRLDDYSNKNSMEAWRLDLDFHRELVALAGYEVLVTEFNKIAVPNLFYHVNRALRSDGSMSHVKLLQALASPNREQAIQELRCHLRSGKVL